VRGGPPAETRFHFRRGITSVVRWLVVVRKRLPFRAVRLSLSWLFLEAERSSKTVVLGSWLAV
jgi:hypothetical protein